MFWARRQPIAPTAFETLMAMPQKDQRQFAERMVQTGEWRQEEVEDAFRIARRLEAFVEEPKRA